MIAFVLRTAGVSLSTPSTTQMQSPITSMRGSSWPIHPMIMPPRLAGSCEQTAQPATPTETPRGDFVDHRHSLLPGYATHHPRMSVGQPSPTAVVNNIQPPVLSSTDPQKVIKFLADRAEYEEKIHALQLTSGARIQVAPWRYSVKRKILTLLYTLGEILFCGT